MPADKPAATVHGTWSGDRCTSVFDGPTHYRCELPAGHENAHSSRCDNAQFVQVWPNVPSPTVTGVQRVSGVCFAHGPYEGNQCPRWPACITDPQVPEYVAMGRETSPTVTLDRETLGKWQKRIERAFYKLGIEHFRGCQINQTEFCTCGALDDRKEFKDAMTEFFALLRAAERQK